MGLHDFTFYDLVNRNAQCFKDRPVWFEVDDGRTLTFAQYKEQVDRLACGLQNSGVKKGDRIGVLGKILSPLRCSSGAGCRHVTHQLETFTGGGGL